jgi:hypothetical protein
MRREENRPLSDSNLVFCNSLPRFSLLTRPLLSIVFVGCAVKGHSYETTAAAPTKSAVYIYRPYNVFGGLVQFPISCEDQSTSLGPGGYHRMVIDPGHLRCSAHTEVTTAVDFETKAGENYYIRESIWPGVILPHVHLDQKGGEEAEGEIRKCAEQ